MVDKRGKSEHRELGWSRRRPRPNRNLRASCRAPAAPTCPHASRHSRAWGLPRRRQGDSKPPALWVPQTVWIPFVGNSSKSGTQPQGIVVRPLKPMPTNRNPLQRRESPQTYCGVMIQCELCAYDERLRFRYATLDVYREHLELVHGIVLDQDGRSVKQPPSPAADDPTTEPSVILPRPHRP